MSSQHRRSFLDLPAEVRSNIYTYATPRDETFSLHWYDLGDRHITEGPFSCWGRDSCRLPAYSESARPTITTMAIPKPLFLLSSTVYKESITQLYSLNHFTFANTATAIRFIETIGPTNAASVQSLSIYHESNAAADFESDMDKILPQLSNIKSLRVDVRRFLLSLDGGLDGIARAFWIVTTKQKRLIKVYYTSRSSEMGGFTARFVADGQEREQDVRSGT